MAIGVGNAFGGGPSGVAARARLVAVSGPQVVTDASDITDLNAVDVALVEQFDELQDVLRTVVTQLCSPSLTVLKLSQTAGSSFYEPTQGWSITASPAVATGNVPPFDWVVPTRPSGVPATVLTNANGFANFQWDPLPPDRTSVVTVTEQDTTTTTPLDWSCRVKLPDGTVIESSGTLDPVNAGLRRHGRTRELRDLHDPQLVRLRPGRPDHQDQHAVARPGRRGRDAGDLDVRRDQHGQHAPCADLRRR